MIMSIANEIQRLQTAKANIKAAIESKGVTVPSATTIDGYAQLINSIPTGDPVIDGHYYRDLGLPSGTKWATMNIGASSETDYGNFYQYGKGANQYAATSGQSDYSGTEDPLATSADTAAQVWGGNWHMPTQAQFEELAANTTYTWTTVNGTNGGLFTSNINGNSIFIPAAGYWLDGSRSIEGSYGSVWSSSPLDSDFAFYLLFRSGGKYVTNSIDRKYGFSVRPVIG
jgi:hypothetical protein